MRKPVFAINVALKNNGVRQSSNYTSKFMNYLCSSVEPIKELGIHFYEKVI